MGPATGRSIARCFGHGSFATPFLRESSETTGSSSTIFAAEVSSSHQVQVQSIQLNFACSSLYRALVGSLLGLFYKTFARVEFGRDLLLKYPRAATFGSCSHTGPTAQFLQQSNFVLTLHGDGWPAAAKLSEPTDQHKTAPDKRIVTRVSGPNPSTPVSVRK